MRKGSVFIVVFFFRFALVEMMIKLNLEIICIYHFFAARSAYIPLSLVRTLIIGSVSWLLGCERVIVPHLMSVASRLKFVRAKLDGASVLNFLSASFNVVSASESLLFLLMLLIQRTVFFGFSSMSVFFDDCDVVVVLEVAPPTPTPFAVGFSFCWGRSCFDVPAPFTAAGAPAS